MTPRSIQKNILEVLVYGSSDEIVNAGDSGSLDYPFHIRFLIRQRNVFHDTAAENIS